MATKFDLLLLALRERVHHLWGRHLEMDLQFNPCQPCERYGVEVMAGLPPYLSWHPIEVHCGDINPWRVVVAMDTVILFAAIDRLMGGRGLAPSDHERKPTLVEEAVARKLVEKLCVGIEDILSQFLKDIKSVMVMPDHDNRAPWEASEMVVDTTLEGGWLDCHGTLRFFWPRELINQAFGTVALKRVGVEQWQTLPWNGLEPLMPQRVVAEPQTQQKTTPAPVLEEVKEAAPRIAFDDFDAVIASLNQNQ